MKLNYDEIRKDLINLELVTIIPYFIGLFFLKYTPNNIIIIEGNAIFNIFSVWYVGIIFVLIIWAFIELVKDIKKKWII